MKRSHVGDVCSVDVNFCIMHEIFRYLVIAATGSEVQSRAAIGCYQGRVCASFDQQVDSLEAVESKKSPKGLIGSKKKSRLYSVSYFKEQTSAEINDVSK